MTKGEHKTRAELGITSQRGHAEKDGKQYLFVTLRNKGNFQNEWQWDGLVHEPAEEEDGGASKDLVGYGVIETGYKERNIMVRYTPGTAYEFIGKEDYMIRYDAKRNKLFLQG